VKGIEVLHQGVGVAVVALHAEHDVTTKCELAALLQGEVPRNDLVVVDVSEALFIDSSFLHNLVQADRAATARGSRFVVQMGTAHIVRRALEVSGLLEVLSVADTRAAAISRN
jgi:anti-anti-sigma factor